MKDLVLFGKTFEVINPRNKSEMLEQWYRLFTHGQRKDIFNCYSSPSQEKCNIYDDWDLWFWEIYVGEWIDVGRWLGVKTYNSFMFTLHAVIVYNGTKYYLVITPLKQIAYKCS